LLTVSSRLHTMHAHSLLLRTFTLFLVLACLPLPLFAQTSSPMASDTPWLDALKAVPPIRVLDPKAASTGSITDTETPVSTLHLTDVGKAMGYLIPPMVVSYFMTEAALKALYPNALPVRGQLRVAAQSETDFVPVAAYLTGARAFYLAPGIASPDLAIDPSLKREDWLYTMAFQRKDTDATVAVTFNRRAHLDDAAYARLGKTYMLALNNMLPAPLSGAERKELQDFLLRTLEPTDGMITLESLPNYTFPDN